MGKKIRWYQWLNPFFYIKMIVLAHLQRATSSLYYNVTEKVEAEIKNMAKKRKNTKKV